MSDQHLSSLLSSMQDLSLYERLYKHLHSHPELSKQEYETADIVARHLRDLDAYQVHTKIGGTGVVGVLENGPGKIVLLRADMDALPVKEETGLEYASKVVIKDKSDGETKPVMHACGHDMHTTCLLAAAEFLSRVRDQWKGTLIVLFQPDEERGGGADAMVRDCLYNKVPVPDCVLGQHVLAMRAGTVGSKVGTIMAASNRYKITLFGRGGHGSMPHRTIDPVVLASSVVLRLQTIVSREVDPSEFAVVSVASLQAGQTENIIADKAVIKVDIRTVSTKTREKIIAAVQRIVKAECAASGSPKDPIFEAITVFPMTVNDETLNNTVAASFQGHFQIFEPDTDRSSASEDVTILGMSQNRPCMYWFFGGIDHQTWDQAEKEGTAQENIPVNHSPFFAPVIQPTMKTGVETLSLAALTMFSQTSV